MIELLIVVALCGHAAGYVTGRSDLLSGWREDGRRAERAAWTRWDLLDMARPDDDSAGVGLRWHPALGAWVMTPRPRWSPARAMRQWRRLRATELARAKLHNGLWCHVCAGWWGCAAAGLWAVVVIDAAGWGTGAAVTLAACGVHTVAVELVWARHEHSPS